MTMSVLQTGLPQTSTLGALLVVKECSMSMCACRRVVKRRNGLLIQYIYRKGETAY